MKNVQGSGVPGQTSEPSTPSPFTEARTIALLERIETGIVDLAARMAAIEERVAALGGEPVSPEKPGTTPPPPRIPPFAVRSDGKVLLSVAHLVGSDLSDHERWEGIVLKDAERGAALSHLMDLFDDAASRTGARILWKDIKRDDEPDGGSSKE